VANVRIELPSFPQLLTEKHREAKKVKKKRKQKERKKGNKKGKKE